MELGSHAKHLIFRVGVMLNAQHGPNNCWSRSVFAKITVSEGVTGTFLNPKEPQVAGISVMSGLHGWMGPGGHDRQLI